MEKIFLAFWWRKYENKDIDKIIQKDNLILLNLEKFSKDELSSYLLEQNIALPYPHIPKEINYDSETFPSWWIIYEYEENFNDSSWFILELFLDNFLNPLFKFDRLWFKKLEYNSSDTFNDWYLLIIDINKLYDFLNNFNWMINYSYWYRSRIYDWVKHNNNEAFRLHTWIELYKLLKDYNNWKSIYFWKKEVMEIGILLETLFTEPNEKESIWYALRRRVHFLTLDLIDNIENKIKEIYNTRSQFVHGSIFDELRKKYEIVSDHEWEDIKEKYTDDMFIKTKEYITILRKVVLLYFKLFERINNWEYNEFFSKGKKISCIDVIELSAFNTKIREDLEKDKNILKEMLSY